jgi:hypothetical protein
MVIIPVVADNPSTVSNRLSGKQAVEGQVRNVVFIAVIMSVALCFPFTAFTDDRPIKATTPLSADEVAIYRAVLQKYGSAESGTLNVSIKTFSFVPESPTKSDPDGDDSPSPVRTAPRIGEVNYIGDRSALARACVLAKVTGDQDQTLKGRATPTERRSSMQRSPIYR